MIEKERNAVAKSPQDLQVYYGNTPSVDDQQLMSLTESVPANIVAHLESGSLNGVPLTAENSLAVNQTIRVLCRVDTVAVLTIGMSLLWTRKYVETVLIAKLHTKITFNQYVKTHFGLNRDKAFKYMRAAELAEKVGMKILSDAIKNPSKIYALLTDLDEAGTIKLLNGETVGGLNLEMCKSMTVEALRKHLAANRVDAITSDTDEKSLPSKTPEQEQLEEVRNASITATSNITLINKGVSSLEVAVEQLQTAAKAGDLDRKELELLRSTLDLLTERIKQLDNLAADKLLRMKVAPLKSMDTAPEREEKPVDATAVMEAVTTDIDDSDRWDEAMHDLEDADEDMDVEADRDDDDGILDEDLRF